MPGAAPLWSSGTDSVLQRKSVWPGQVLDAAVAVGAAAASSAAAARARRRGRTGRATVPPWPGGRDALVRQVDLKRTRVRNTVLSMASGESTYGAERIAQREALAREWKRLSRAATVVALLTSPVTFAWLHVAHDWAVPWALLAALVGVVMFRGFIDVLAHRMIPRASLYGAGRDLLDEDIVSRRRVWYWRTKFRRLSYLALVVARARDPACSSPASRRATSASSFVQVLPVLLSFGIQLPLLFLINLLILFGPLLFFGLKQMKGYEPGDADWGVKLDDIRGQKEPKQEVTRVIELWSAGDDFRKAGGKPERGLLFIGAPGTGKTMLSKGIATLVQRADRDDARLRLRPDLHRHGRRHRHVPDPQGAQARAQVGRHVHDLHRRDRRRRHAPPGARRRGRGLRAAARRLPRAAAVRPVGRDHRQRRRRDRERRVARAHVRRRARRRRPRCTRRRSPASRRA